VNYAVGCWAVNNAVRSAAASVNYAVRSTVGCTLRCAVGGRLVNYAVRPAVNWRSPNTSPDDFHRAPTTKTPHCLQRISNSNIPGDAWNGWNLFVINSASKVANTVDTATRHPKTQLQHESPPSTKTTPPRTSDRRYGLTPFVVCSNVYYGLLDQNSL
jgi:hypothetical protein